MLRARVERALAAVTLRLPRTLLRAVSGGARPAIDGEQLDAQVQVLLWLKDRLGKPEIHHLPVAEARRAFREQSAIIDARPLASVTSDDRRIPGPGGEMAVRVYRPRGLEAPAPAVVYFHGGGWVIGDLETHDAPCRLLASLARCLVVSVDYRLAPEQVFPAAVDDALAAFLWVCREAPGLGVHPGRVAVGGDSAGGTLSAVVARLARDAGGPAPALQLLIYPATDMTRSLPSQRTFAEGYLLSGELMDWFRNSYLPDASLASDPRASPLAAEDLRGLAPAVVLTAGYDPLRDEGRAYADRLEAAGVAVAYRCYPGLVHGFWTMTGVVDEARRAFEWAAGQVRGELEGARARG